MRILNPDNSPVASNLVRRHAPQISPHQNSRFNDLPSTSNLNLAYPPDTHQALSILQASSLTPQQRALVLATEAPGLLPSLGSDNIMGQFLFDSGNHLTYSTDILRGLQTAWDRTATTINQLNTSTDHPVVHRVIHSLVDFVDSRVKQVAEGRHASTDVLSNEAYISLRNLAASHPMEPEDRSIAQVALAGVKTTADLLGTTAERKPYLDRINAIALTSGAVLARHNSQELSQLMACADAVREINPHHLEPTPATIMAQCAISLQALEESKRAQIGPYFPIAIGSPNSWLAQNQNAR